MIRLILVEDQALVRQGIRGLLRLVPEVEVVAEAVDGKEAVETICRERPDAVLLDLRLPKQSGVEVIEQLSRRNALPPTVALTTFDDEALMIETVRAGARGFLLKDVSLEELSRAIRNVAAGGTYFQPAVTQGVQRRFAKLDVEIGGLDPADPLSGPRDRGATTDCRRPEQPRNRRVASDGRRYGEESHLEHTSEARGEG